MSCNTRPRDRSCPFCDCLGQGQQRNIALNHHHKQVFSRVAIHKYLRKEVPKLASLKLYYNKHSSQNDCAIIFLFFLIAWVRCRESVPSLLTSSDLFFCFCRLLFADTSPRHCIISLRFFSLHACSFFFSFLSAFQPTVYYNNLVYEGFCFIKFSRVWRTVFLLTRC